MRAELATLPPKIADGIRARLVRLLVASPFSMPRTWCRAVVVITPERECVLHRLAFAAELRDAGLLEAAHEAAVRRVGRGEVLVHLVVDNEEAAGAAFVVVPLVEGMR